MKKITLSLLVCLFSLVAFASVNPTSKVNQLKANHQGLALKAVDETPVTPPEGIEPVAYSFKGFDTYVNRYKESEVFVVVDGSDVYIKGLSLDYLPTGWVKGTMTDNVLTIPEQYMGIFSFWGDDYDLFFDGAEFIYNPDTDVFTAANGYTTTAEETVLDEYNDVTLTGVEIPAATPVNPEITAFERDDYGIYAKMNIPLQGVDGSNLYASYMYYQMYRDMDGDIAPIVLTEDDYVFLGVESMSEVPYNFTDSYDVDVAGKQVYLYDANMRQWTRFGVKSIYLGGNERHESEIVWYNVSSVVGIETVGADAPVVSVNYYDITGRPATATTSGILIKQVRLADGTVKTMKVMGK